MSGRFLILFVVACVIVASVNGHRRCKRRRNCCDCCEAPSPSVAQSTSQSAPPSVPPTVPPSVKPSTSQSFSPSTSSCPSPGCPNGWKHYSKYCYKVINSPIKARDSYDQLCRQENSQLVSIHDASENQFVVDLVPELINENIAIWIGMTLADATNAFNSPKYWTDQANRYLQSGDYGYASGELPWGSPIGPFDGSDANCTMMWTSSMYDRNLRGKWENANCNTGTYIDGAVCKTQQICNSVPPTTMLPTGPPIPSAVPTSVPSTTAAAGQPGLPG